MRLFTRVPVVSRVTAAGVFDVWAREHGVRWFGRGFASIRGNARRDHHGSLYFATPTEGEGDIKIGFSTTPGRRASSFRTQDGRPYVGAVFVDGFDQVSERLLHVALAPYATHGEFYESASPIAELMRRLRVVASRTQTASLASTAAHRAHKCSLCKEQGHNRATCANQIGKAG